MFNYHKDDDSPLNSPVQNLDEELEEDWPLTNELHVDTDWIEIIEQQRVIWMRFLTIQTNKF